MREKILTVQYGKQNSEIRSRERKAARIQVGRIKREEIHGDPMGYKTEVVARLLFEWFYGMSPWVL